MKKSKSFAFTLAEVLITLGIIGVIAAITIPALVKNYQKQVYKTAAQKAYSAISQAATKIVADSEFWASGNWHTESWGMYNAFYPNFQIAKRGDLQGVIDINNYYAYPFDNKYKFKVSDNNPTYEYMPAILTTDNMLLIFRSWGSGYPNSCYITVDTNGLQPPNRWGDDIVAFFINQHDKGTLKVEPAGGIHTTSNSEKQTDILVWCSSTNSFDGWATWSGNAGCTYKLLFN